MKKLIIALVISCFALSSVAQHKKVNFSEAFKKENKGKFHVEVNEIKELLIIMQAITDFGLENDDMFEQKGKYYQDVIAHFKPFKNEPIIVKMDSLLKVTPLNYIFFTGNSKTYNFDGDTLTPDPFYLFPAQEVSKVKVEVNPITTYKTEIEAFAKKSEFRKFYKAHQAAYEGIYQDYQQKVNVQKQWKWLEKNFEAKTDCYVIYTSLLINGLNYTTGYDEGGFKLIEMILPPPTEAADKSEKANEAFNTRVMFTEIDHNYVGAPSKKHKADLEVALKDRDKWVNKKAYGTEYYPDGERVFNEYMTYAVFILYAQDNWKKDPQLLDEVEKEVIATMISRGFIKMSEFTAALKELRSENKKQKIDQLYPALIKWCAGQ